MYGKTTHGPTQELKQRCSLGDVSILISSQPKTNISPYKNEVDGEFLLILSYCGYTSHEIRDGMHVEPYGEDVLGAQPNVEQANVLETSHRDVWFPPFSY
jgi:hypothetical protein